MVLKAVTVFVFILISVPIFSPSSASGGRRRSMNEFTTAQGVTEETHTQIYHHGANAMQNRRKLRVQINDYYSYNPRPAMVKPRFKLIPN